MKEYKTIPKKVGTTVPTAGAIALAAFSASIGVLVTAIACAQFFAHSSIRCYDAVVLSSTSASHRPNILRTRGGLNHAAKALSLESDSGKAQRTLETKVIAKEESGPWPKVIWLMSFPNSGTSYTLHLIRESTNMTTATNYALEGDIKDAPSVPVHRHEKNSNGPFLELIRERNTTVPTTYILTKTHCNAFCSDCLPKGYIETPRSFEIACRSGRRASFDSKGLLKKEMVTYERGKVAKAIHLFRHPLDNIVARFHLEYHNKKKNKTWLENHPYNRDGFITWCREMDSMSQLRKYRWVDGRLWSLLEKIPCHEEFYRYVQWHNLAFTVTHNNNIPVHILQYHDYSNDFDRTLEKLLYFLQLPRNGKLEPFEPGKEYHSYYSETQRTDIRNFIEEFASASTWDQLKGYKF